MRLLLAFLAVAACTLLPSLAGAQEPLIITPDAAPLLDPSALPALLPAWLERLLSYAAVAGTALVALANMLGSVLRRVREAGGDVPRWLDVAVGVLLDVGTDVGALRERLLGPRLPTANGSQTPPA
jgi:hypothetical protein